eukprot:TRINITY_DN1688_c0_g1_i4.p1 TRINITY_DN1688_c0_g1~~TRINITY_DN1688_c0_g1_i4.p1  ORF type:complete len:450 (+),score=76.95 TRINITY_DN1688_c0_g1_i4:153-1502(+)
MCIRDRNKRQKMQILKKNLINLINANKLNITSSVKFSLAKQQGEKIYNNALYFDYQATTPMDFRVLDAMMPFQTKIFGNPGSSTHCYGWEANQAIERARKQIADVIKCDSKDLIFTSGATECNNMAIKGLASFHKNKKHIITTNIEHKCILESCRSLIDQGYEITFLPVNKDGLVTPEQVEKSIRPDTLLVSTIFVHNEIGVIQNIKGIGEVCRKKKVFFHTDAAQGFGKIPINVDEMNIDLMSLTAHKIYGPKGIGALYVRRKPKVRILPLLNGGGQERGLRSGTLAPHLIVGFGEAARICQYEMQNDYNHLQKLHNYIKSRLFKEIPHIQMNGHEKQRYPGNINISFKYVEGESLLMGIKTCAVSSGSACTSSTLEPSYVLKALGVDEDVAHTSLRIGLGRFTTEEEAKHLVHTLTTNVKKLRELSPLWEMVQEGIDLKSIKWAQPH